MTKHTSRLVVLAAIGLLTTLIAACGGTPAASVMTSPTEIILSTLSSAETAKSVHVDVDVEGSAAVALPGLGGTGAPIDLTGTSAAADLDIAGAAARATFSVPALFNLSGEVIAVDDQGYVKTTIGGAKYERIDLSTFPVDLTDAPALIDNLGDFLMSSDIELVKGPDVACGDVQCYTVTADVSADQLTTMLGGAAAGLPVDLAGASVAVTVRVEQTAPNHLAGLTLAITTAPDQTLTADLTFSKWDESVSITAPAADQVKGS